ncbi:HNH endonuclease signature motif containing protein [Nocardioides phosphati]|nr:HNH endonuclease signature motif containing protein [Nocardioides phosphati]
MEKVVKDDNDCWLWQAKTGWQGYGLFWSGEQRTTVAHRWAWEQRNGPIPDGLQLDHLCRVRHCVNPDHLEPVTPRENVMRGDTPAARNAAKTHCARAGHPLSGPNLYISPKGARECRTCRNAASARYEHKKVS